jgi:hypothetical protein
MNEEEIESIADEVEFLLFDMEECYQKDQHVYILYHHDCMSGTSCDACRILDRIKDIHKRLTTKGARQ